MYAPRDFPRTTSITSFAKAVNNSHDRTTTLDKLISSAVEATMLKHLPNDVNREDLQAGIQEAVQIAHEKISDAYVIVDMSAVDPRQPQIAISIDDMTSAQGLLDELWLDVMNSYVPAYTYGETWVLVDVASGRQLLQNDARPAAKLVEFGVAAGSKLRIRMLAKSSR